jgi:hypothetical protein
MKEVPEVFTSRYFAEEVLSSGLVIPVRISLRSPQSLGIELPYPLEHGILALAPERDMLGEWDKLSPAMWQKLEAIGVEAIVEKLAAISEANENKALALLCWEDLRRPTKCHRTTVSLWLETATQRPVPELTDDGELLGLADLHRRTAPVLPQPTIPRMAR